jgi:S-formylglutathione hydrolase FrmB
VSDRPARPCGDAQHGAISRRTVLAGAAGLAAVAVVGTVGYEVMPMSVRARLGLLPDPYIPDAPEGRVRLETVHSDARGRDVNLFTAVPAGHGDGAGLPVVVALHGVTATAADYQDFGFGRFLTAAVRAGAAPFVLAGADGSQLYWQPDPASDDDPRRMVVDEMPRWLADRGFDAERRALWGWSMGGYGSLGIAEAYPNWSRALAAFSPAVSEGDAVFAGVDSLAELPLGVWCGTDDPLYDAVRELVADLPRPPQVVTYAEGGHTRIFWNDHTIDAFSFLASHLTA